MFPRSHYRITKDVCCVRALQNISLLICLNWLCNKIIPHILRNLYNYHKIGPILDISLKYFFIDQKWSVVWWCIHTFPVKYRKVYSVTKIIYLLICTYDISALISHKTPIAHWTLKIQTGHNTTATICPTDGNNCLLPQLLHPERSWDPCIHGCVVTACPSVDKSPHVQLLYADLGNGNSGTRVQQTKG